MLRKARVRISFWRHLCYRSHFGSRYQIAARYTQSRFSPRLRPVCILCISRSESPKLFRVAVLERTHVSKLTWLALAEDHAALSRSLEQLMALPRPVKVKRVPLVPLVAKFLAAAVSVRATANNENTMVAIAYSGRLTTKPKLRSESSK